DTLIKIFIGIVPAVLLGAFTNLSEIITNSLNIVFYTGVAYIALSVLLYISKNLIEGEKGISSLTYLDALYIGLAQSVALMPGVSRAGVTLIAALLIGMNKKDALLFSFLLGIPTIGGAWVFSLVSYGIDYSLLTILSTLLAFIFGLLAIRILIRFTLDSNLYKFSFYTFALGLIAIIVS
ncbi:MAG: undecaprenyl-diphosphate phosphatase, partial [Actinomycetota bacterium]|nr:undecaprenyl-diphosphate phosphatase [Actinomycetota bacterium]